MRSNDKARPEYWGSLTDEARVETARQIMAELPLLLERAAESLRNDDYTKARDGVLRALRARAALDVGIAMSERDDLASEVRKVDASLDDRETLLDVIEDSEYLEVVLDEPADSTTWWSRRWAVMKALPMEVIELAIRRVGADADRGITPDEISQLSEHARALAEISDSYAEDFSRLAAASEPTSGRMPRLEYLPMSSISLGQSRMDAWLVRVDEDLYVRLLANSEPPVDNDSKLTTRDEPDLPLKRVTDLDCIFSVPILATLPAFSSGHWYHAGTYLESLMRARFQLECGAGAAALALDVARLHNFTDIEERAVSLLSCARDRRWVELVLGMPALAGAPDDSIKEPLQIGLLFLAESNVAGAVRDRVGEASWARVCETTWIAPRLREMLRRAR